MIVLALKGIISILKFLCEREYGECEASNTHTHKLTHQEVRVGLALVSNAHVTVAIHRQVVCAVLQRNFLAMLVLMRQMLCESSLDVRSNQLFTTFNNSYQLPMWYAQPTCLENEDARPLRTESAWLQEIG